MSGYQLSVAAGERFGGKGALSERGRLQPSDMGASQEDWEVSSLDLRKPDKPSCPVLNSGLALFLGDTRIT